ncbi:hypoxanthine/guanine phosphoribosyltransferase [Methanosalsum natronophilum]|uniref:Hypoxanthine/guanine phosphoribosyltransferase n=1 Tax=Methanosalsum natronophilum TaxID=768733 RepID=A0A424Z0Z9_9EURY|nr:hypoxanthine/guanine phosphoribosyltransferase [Methanosalsum natronophilum]MCS3923534.1 adenine phosphoribosyltransferase [Methanosalsum natronophilum]RQD87878.1 MAG: purine phosphoribosyltransferase family protein [Methanosalsum natronophilum]
MNDKLYNSLINAPTVNRGNYTYFIHPISDGVPLLEPSLLNEISDNIIEKVDMDVDCIITIEAMGIPIATSLSLKTGVPVSIVRKRKYELPGEIEISQSTGYSKGKLYINGISADTKVLIVDDVLSTGGTLRSLVKALGQIGAQISDIVVVIERGNGAKELAKEGLEIISLSRVDVIDNKVVVERIYGENKQ